MSSFLLITTYITYLLSYVISASNFMPLYKFYRQFIVRSKYDIIYASLNVLFPNEM